MEFDPFVASLPALIALSVKTLIIFYATLSNVHSRHTRLFLLTVFGLAIHDVANISHTYVLARGQLPTFEFAVFYAAGIVSLALALHLALTVSVGQRYPHRARAAATVAYAYAALLLILLVFTDHIMQGVRPVGYTVTRIPGSAYPLLELYVLCACLAFPALFAYGALRLDTGVQRARNALLLAGALPALAVIGIMMVLLHFEIRWLSATAVLPLSTTVFLGVSAYAIYQHRLFDIQFFIPWSRTRRRKTSFHDGIRRLIEDIADLPSSSQIVQRLSDALSCPVALLAPNRTVFAGATARKMAQVPNDELAAIDQIVVAEEIADSRPTTYRCMKEYGVAAVVPFHPHSENASGWLLLGESFNQQVNSPLDFRLVEELFSKMSELFLDRFVALQSQLRSSNRQLRSVTAENVSLKAQLEKLERAHRTLVNERQALLASDIAREVTQEFRNLDEVLAPNITFVGRDRAVTRVLRKEFRSFKSYVGFGSRSLARAPEPTILVARLEDAAVADAYLQRLPRPFACIVYGPAARDFGKRWRNRLGNGIVDMLPPAVDPAVILSRVMSMAYLRRHCHWAEDDHQPLIGCSPPYCSFIQQLQICAGFDDPVLFFHDDPELAATTARYVHHYGDRDGSVQLIATPADIPTTTEGGTNAVIGIESWERTQLDELVAAVRRPPARRWLLACDVEHAAALDPQITSLARTFQIRVPGLHERREDIALLVHYYTLRFNLCAGSFKSMSHAEVRSLKLHEPGWTLNGLRASTYDFLARQTEEVTVATDMLSTTSIETISQQRNLEELVGEFERRIIEQALERTNGNQAETARLLGMRPNTLHYKLERHGLSRARREKRTRD